MFMPSRYLLCLVAAVFAAHSQTPEFEVASIKPSAPATAAFAAELSERIAERISFKGGPGSGDPGRINYSGISLRMLLARAYGLRTDQILGPAWLGTEFYDIVAKVPPGATAEQVIQMLQPLLIQRFRIESHRESRQMRVYLLGVAKSAPKLMPATTPAPPPTAEELAKITEARRIATMRAARESAALGGSATNVTERYTNFITLPSATLGNLAEQLSRQLNATVIDQTGIEGKYSFKLRWAADDVRATPPSDSSDLRSGPTISSAIQGQLGLKLEPGSAPVEVLVVDKADKVPTEN